MAKTLAAITGVQGFIPKDVLTNADLEKIVDTTDEWIMTRTGIRERRVLKGMAASDMGAEIVKGLLQKTNTAPDEIEMLICATITGDMTFPDTANTILDKAGCKNAFGYDINAACSGFLFALQTAAKFVETGTYKKVIVIGMDVMSSIIDYSDRTTCVIFGDGGGGVLLEPDTEGNGIQDAILRADGMGRHYLHMKAGGSTRPPTAETVARREHYVYQEGKHVFRHAVNGMSSTINELMQRNEMTIDDVRWLVPHQANMRIIGAVGDAVNIPAERVMVNIQKYGNTTAGTLPLCLHDYESQLRKGDNVFLTAFGGGFTWGTIYLKWAYDPK